MRIAILGATSQIARDLIFSFFLKTQVDLVLYGRDLALVKVWCDEAGIKDHYQLSNYENLAADGFFDVIINFVGVGDPGRAKAMGSSIFDLTLQYDNLALTYIQQRPECRYVFLSSGAVYGGNFEKPVDKNSSAIIPVNCIQPQDWYGVAKMHAECRHRALPHLSIVDIRVFNYFSRSIDISARFFIADILRAIEYGETLMTSADNIIRDYIGPSDFFRLVSLILESPATNDVVDCYTKAPVEKFTLLSNMQEHFGLKYKIQNVQVGINATGTKLNYFSKNYRASIFGYAPSFDSLETLKNELEKMALQKPIYPANKLDGNFL